MKRGDDDTSILASTGDRTLMIQAFDRRGDMAVMYDENSHMLVRADNLFGDIQLKDLYTTEQCNSV